MASSTLFPPILNGTMASFIHDEECTVYFRFSDYNTINDISGLIFTLVYQKTNKTALITSLAEAKKDTKKATTEYYPIGQVYIPKSYIKVSEEDNDLYYFKISEDVDKGSPAKVSSQKDGLVVVSMKRETAAGEKTKYRFLMNSYFKLQIRFVESGIASPGVGVTNEWVNGHLGNISEWSEVTLLKPIYAPYLKLCLNDYKYNEGEPIIMRSLPTTKTAANSTNKTVSITIDESPQLDFTGYFANYNKTINSLGEDIYYYQFRLESEDGTLIWYSDKYYTAYDTASQIDTSFVEYIEDGTYYLSIRMQTMGGYITPYYYVYKIEFKLFSKQPIYFIPHNDFEDAYIGFTLPRGVDPYIWYGKRTTPPKHKLLFTKYDGKGEYETWQDAKNDNKTWKYYLGNEAPKVRQKAYVFRKTFGETTYKYLMSYYMPNPYLDGDENKDDDIDFKDFTVQAGEFYSYRVTSNRYYYQSLIDTEVQSTLENNVNFNDYNIKDAKNILTKFQYGCLKELNEAPSNLTNDEITSLESPPMSLNRETINKVTDAYDTISETLSDYEDMFLYAGKTLQLKLQYNPTVSSFQYKLSDSAYDTLGSQYPILVRNGDLYYRTYPISGLISMYMDENEYFADRDSDMLVYKYERGVSKYRTESMIDDLTIPSTSRKQRTMSMEFYEEKRFRDKVIAFLNDGKPKLLKSPSEGNAIVKITNVSFAPNQALGRRIWSFSATVTEFCEFNLDNCNKYELVEDYGAGV